MLIGFSCLLSPVRMPAQEKMAQPELIQTDMNAEPEKKPKVSFYDFVVTDIDGKEFKFSTLKGKKVMVVNTASKCGYTPQYKELEALYQKYKDMNFVVIGFPSNDFGGQEPGTNKEISTFCQKNYGVTFPMMAKVSVTNEQKAPVYRYLTDATLNQFKTTTVKWNFQKYLISADGRLEKILESDVTPMDPKITSWIEAGNPARK